MLKKTLNIILLVLAPLCATAAIVDCQSVNRNDIKLLLLQHADTLSPALIRTTNAILSCSHLCTNHLTLIDYSLPSNQKRIWIFDLKDKKLLYHTYVSHGLKSGIREAHFFTNALNSKASSLGVYVTGESYHGRDGLSLKLTGLEKHFNDNASRRSLVMHSAWYANEDFIKKYGRTGRSWGCPALPMDMAAPVIQTIKDQSLVVVYYPSDQWLSNSAFLRCGANIFSLMGDLVQPLSIGQDTETRGDILYADVNKNNKLDANVPVMCISAENYQRIFKTSPPLSRMLRRQVNKTEYIAINLHELRQLDKNSFAALEFFLPELYRIGGYFGTRFKPANLGTVVDIDFKASDPVVITAKSRITFKSTDKFIRWIGL